MVSVLFGPRGPGMEPAVWVGNKLYVKTRGPSDACFMDARGHRHVLKLLAKASYLDAFQQDINRPELELRYNAEIAKNHNATRLDPLHYFVAHIAPAFKERDWNAGYEDTYSIARTSSEGFGGIAHTGFKIPLPEKSLLWSEGQVWELERGRASGELGQVFVNEEQYRVSERRFSPADFVRQVEQALCRRASEKAAETAREMRAKIGEAGLPALDQARQDIAATGAHEIGDLLYIAGPRPFLGHIIPSHQNISLKQHIQRDVAMTAILEPLRAFSVDRGTRGRGLSVHRKNGGGRWVPYTPPNKLCIGGNLPRNHITEPGLAMAAFLRWAALRIAANKKFHESD